jgi:hypothetical protein
MRVYVGFDDTDVAGADRGTGKLARWFAEKLPEGIQFYGVVRQQLPMLDGIPYTSHNSSACLILDDVEPSQVDELIELGSAHIREHFLEGSDPGLCVAAVQDSAANDLMEFGRQASSRIVSQHEAMTAAQSWHLSGHGGSNDGIIGAAAGVGLTVAGWSGRFIEFNGLRAFAPVVAVAALESRGIRVLSIDRNAPAPGYDDLVDTRGWLRPRLWAGVPVLPVVAAGHGSWQSVGEKNGHRTTGAAAASTQG